ncbi:unnamed protein product [Rotaria sordida]|uniref:NADH dehydrogenase [ubiquinone] 1 beta subcomplex subunit 8, mitochondrial n=1 Tax=Rotaria sordida TaxID=392033 RepID=A0A813N9Y9_9BILA|nr:unnamed protein product [Rotaria sordida]CAF0731103.1 unnamed protein product [Rotaria sordida]CAF0732570.1 unnamed protein product [Rotaria sordida]CAF0755392.1 unnamed protein product [Rotaria sordida]CAF0755521.1 unnamed protein product [Rotaria sordida]
MNHLIGLSKRNILLINRLPIQTTIRTVLNNREWRPKEDVPVTAEDRAATAKKYNMLPEDYKPLPPERNAGDMPSVEPAGKFFDRSPWEDYDYPMDRQNWNEPRHPSDHVKYDKTRVGYSPQKRPVTLKILLRLLLLPATFILGVYGLRTFEFMTPSFPSRKPEPGAVHYSFEKDDGSGQGVRY